MCYYTLRTCAYPQRDTVSSLIFDPHQNKHWIECDQPKPWGRMSCGNLIVKHPKTMQMPVSNFECPSISSTLANTDEADPNNLDDTPTKGSSALLVVTPTSDYNPSLHDDGHLFQECEWCTTILKVVATKAKYLQKEAGEKIRDLEQFITSIPEIMALYDAIAKKEKELDEKRHEAWKEVTAALASNLTMGPGKKESATTQDGKAEEDFCVVDKHGHF